MEEIKIHRTTAFDWVIKSERQENGLYGMPMRVLKVDKIVFLGDKLDLLRTAIIIAVAEYKPNSFLEVWFSDERGFMMEIRDDKSFKKEFHRFNYKDYKLEGNTLKYIGKVN